MPIEHRASGSWRGSRLRRARRGTAWGNVCDLFLPNLWGHTLAINRRTHSSPPASGDSDDRIDMALLNFENDPADVLAADPKELRARARGDFEPDAVSSGRFSAYPTSWMVLGWTAWAGSNREDREESVDVVRSVRGTRRRSLGDLVAFVSLLVEVMVVDIGERASSKSDPVLFLAFR